MMLLALRGTGETGDRILVRFTYPNDIKGTAFLVWEHPNADDERFLYLPALGRVRRIAGGEKQESFIGSDLSYEDIGGRELADYTYSFTDSSSTWTAPDGSKHAASSTLNRLRRRRSAGSSRPCAPWRGSRWRAPGWCWPWRSSPPWLRWPA